MIQYIFYHNKLKKLKEQELNDVHSFCLNSNNKLFQKNWKQTLNDLQQFYNFAKKRNIEIVLLIFPYTFQLFSPELQEPQKILANHARTNNVRVIDFTKVIENRLLEDGYNKSGNYSKYYLDEDHYNTEGNKLIADTLYKFITISILNN